MIKKILLLLSVLVVISWSSTILFAEVASACEGGCGSKCEEKCEGHSGESCKGGCGSSCNHKKEGASCNGDCGSSCKEKCHDNCQGKHEECGCSKCNHPGSCSKHKKEEAMGCSGHSAAESYVIAKGGKCEGDVSCCCWGGECLGDNKCCKKLACKK
jgi:hypothetical protein